MKFYRLEHREGRYGVYTHPDINLDETMRELGFPTRANDRHPMIYADSLLMDNCKAKNVTILWHNTTDRHRFGFSSMEQLRAWFYDDAVLKALGTLGIVLGVYEAEIIEGNAQSLMHPSFHNEFHRIEDIDLSSLVNIS